MRKRMVATAAGALVGVLAMNGVVLAGHDDPNELHVCIRDDKFIRFVDDPTQCRSGETPKSWNRQGVPGERGADGVDGATWYTGTGDPGADLGRDGDFYLDEATGDVLLRTVEGWAAVANIRGPRGETGDTGEKGERGDDGATWYAGSGPPNPALGAEGDFYLDGVTGDVSVKAPDGWSSVANLKGPRGEKGDAGEKGDRGDAGEDGSTWYGGAGAPSDGLGRAGDFYLDATNGSVSTKTASGWAPLTNITGPRGDKGDRGDPGAAGADGATWHWGSGGPEGYLGAVGDHYLDTASGDVYVKADDGWLPVGNLRGPQGRQGPEGPPGASANLSEAIPVEAASEFDSVNAKRVQVFCPSGYAATGGGHRIGGDRDSRGDFKITVYRSVPTFGGGLTNGWEVAAREGEQGVFGEGHGANWNLIAVAVCVPLGS